MNANSDKDLYLYQSVPWQSSEVQLSCNKTIFPGNFATFYGIFKTESGTEGVIIEEYSSSSMWEISK